MENQIQMEDIVICKPKIVTGRLARCPSTPIFENGQRYIPSYCNRNDKRTFFCFYARRFPELFLLAEKIELTKQGIFTQQKMPFICYNPDMWSSGSNDGGSHYSSLLCGFKVGER